MSSGNHPPGLLMMHLLGRCNLECQHCYMDGHPRRVERLPLAAVLRALKECPALGIQTVCLTGGEPLLYPDLERVLEVTAALPDTQTTLCTNGTLLTARRAQSLASYKLHVNISIDGRPEFHDSFRHLSGAFELSERGARAAVDAGMELSIISSISQANIDSVAFLVAWAKQMGAADFMVQPLLNMGRGARIADDCLTFHQLNRLILQLTDLSNRHRLKCQIIGARKSFLLKHPCGAFVCNGTGCHRGVEKEIKKLVIREDGTILPEVPTLSHEYAIGHITEGSLASLVTRYFAGGYAAFDRLCRAAYSEVLPGWDCVIVPWEQILSERSRSWAPTGPAADAPCFTCDAPAYGALKGRSDLHSIAEICSQSFTRAVARIEP